MWHSFALSIALANPMTDPNNWLAEKKIKFVECLVPDFSGIAKGKTLRAQDFAEGEIRIAEAIFGQDLLGKWVDDEDLIDVADIDMILVPDTGTLVEQPWSNNLAQCLCDCDSLRGGVLEMAPRTLLKRMVSKFADMGLEPVIAQEAEFYLVERNPDPLQPLNAAPGASGRVPKRPRSFQSEAIAEYAPFLESLHRFADVQGIRITSTVQEMGQGQIEVNFHHASALEKADEMFYFKRIAKQAALEQGYIATFMAKPMSNAPGSAMHLHQSLVEAETGENMFAGTEGRFSDRFYAYLGGLQKYTPLAIALFAPSVNSFRRFEGAESCPTNVEWGIDNRTTGFRVPKCDAPGTRIENRIPGSDNNPYLAIALSLACGYLGLRENLRPTDPVEDSAWDREDGFPSTLADALDELENCEALMDLLGERFVKLFIHMRREEIASFSAQVTPWEREHLLLTV